MPDLPPSPTTAKTPTDTAIEIACNNCYHRSLLLPATATHAALKVTYGATSNFDGEEGAALPTLLFCGPMGATRYGLMDIDHVAREAGVRIVFIDRPGFGASSLVPLDQRMDTWIETVPAVLQKLGVRHVKLMSHSAGTLYLLNTLLRLTEILDPVNPTAILLAPWVHPDHSGVGLLNYASKLPKSWIGSMGIINNFVGTSIVPSLGYSSGVIESIAAVFRSDDQGTAVGTSGDSTRKLYGLDLETTKELWRLQNKYRSAECPQLEGVGQDALLCLKKGGSFWGVCDDYAAYVADLTKHLREFRESGKLEGKLTVRVAFSESDMMIGKGGQEYFDKCFSEVEEGGVMSYESWTVTGTNHDSIMLPGSLLAVLKKGLS